MNDDPLRLALAAVAAAEQTRQALSTGERLADAFERIAALLAETMTIVAEERAARITGEALLVRARQVIFALIVCAREGVDPVATLAEAEAVFAALTEATGA